MTKSQKPAERVLRDTLDRIREQARSKITNPLEIGYYEADFMDPFDFASYRIFEVHKKRWLGIIPYKSYRLVFHIYEGFFGGALPQGPSVWCAIYDSSLKEIIEEEVGKYAEAFQASCTPLDYAE